MADTPNLIATLAQEIRVGGTGRLDSNEHRGSTYGALNLFREQTASSTGLLDATQIAALKGSFGNAVKLGVIDYENVSLLSARTCDLQVGGPKTNLMSVTFATYGFGLAMYPAAHFNNDVSYETVMRRSLEARLRKLALQLDTVGRNKLEADKNTVWTGTTGFYANSGNALRVPLASKGDWFNNIASVMEVLDFDSSALDILTNPRGMADVRALMANGSNNAYNTAYQFGSQQFYQSNRVTNGSGVQSTSYLVAPDTLAMVSRVDPDSLMGHTSTAGQEWFVLNNAPIVNLDLGVLYQSKCTDVAAATAAALSLTDADTRLGGLTASLVESFLYTVDVAFITAYNSDASTRANPIVKVEVLTS